jgi:hypothetical protein
MNHILSLGARAACALLFTGATACAASDGPSDPGTIGENADEASVTLSSFVTLRADLRRCLAPVCGGYFVSDVNRQRDEQYVSGLDFTESGLPTDAIGDVRSAPPNELVLRGHLGLPEPRFHTRPFVVLEAFRGMPNVTPREGDAFYQVDARRPPIACFVAPCPNEIASLLNTTSEEAFDRISVDRAALPWVDKRWLASRVATHDAVAVGAFAQGEYFPGGFEKVLEVSQVFVRLPERVGPCPTTPQFLCTEGTIVLQKRTEDRCFVQLGCVVSTLCAQSQPMPECASGYTLASWAEPPSGCPTFACDPSFIIR